MTTTGTGLAAHLPVFLIAVPLIAAPVCSLLRAPNLAWVFTLLTSVFTAYAAVAVLQSVLAQGEIAYHLGGWLPPFGIELRIDAANAFVLLIIAIMNLIAVPYAFQSIENEVPTDKHHLFYTAWLLSLAGMLGITATGDAFNIFVFLEIAALSSYILIASGRDSRALTASYQYLVLGTLGATFILIGIGLIYIMTGTLNIADIADRVGPIAHTAPIKAAAGFLTVGIAMKFAMFPAHFWLPNAYAYAPSAVSVFLSATATKVAVYLLLRFELTVFGQVDMVNDLPLSELLMPLALTSILFGSTAAVFQKDLKRMLAYSSVAQVGYMVLGLSFGSLDGVTGGIVHLFNHALVKAALFMVLGVFVLRAGSARLQDLAGIGRAMPVTMGAFVVGGLGLIGVPLTVGFVSKWYLIMAALATGVTGYMIVGVVVVSSLLAVIYVWRFVEVAYFREPSDKLIGLAPAHWTMLLPMWCLLGASIWFGIDTELSVGTARHAAEILLGVVK